MVDLDGVMHTLTDGACRSDKTLPNPAIPFDLEIRGMVCYKRWSKSIPLTDSNVNADEPVVVEEEETEENEEGESAEAEVDYR